MIRVWFLTIFAIFIVGCNIDLDPCTYEVGDTFEVKIYATGYVGEITLNRKGCDIPVILSIKNKYLAWREVGDIIKVVVIKRIDEHYYHVRVIK